MCELRYSSSTAGESLTAQWEGSLSPGEREGTLDRCATAGTKHPSRKVTNALGAHLDRGSAAGQATRIGLFFLVEELRREPPRVLGVTLAVLSAASFALNNAAARRAVLTGTPAQGMALTVLFFFKQKTAYEMPK